jgi:beta-lactamase regulating signal transducer with metallopeptidase domain
MSAILVVKASLLLSTTLFAVFLLRRGPAVVRHRLWTLAFAALLALPLLTVALPALDVPLPAWAAPTTPAVSSATPPAMERRTVATPAASTARAAVAGTSPETGAARAMRAAADPPTFRHMATEWGWTLLLAAWLVGAGLAAGRLALSLLRVHRLSRSADAIGDPAWRDAADTLGGRLGLARPVRLLASAEVGTPMAAGTFRPTIFLPTAASQWTAEVRDIVLAHEIAHLAVRDPLRHVTARLALSCYWFHPLAWIGARQGTLAREQACDDAVLALGIRPSIYAGVLLDLAGALRPQAAAHGALPMVDRSLLETRVMAILSDARPVIARRAALPVAGMALLTCTVAAAQPGARPAPAAAAAPSVAAAPASPAAAAQAEARPSAAATAARPAQPASRESACDWDRWNGGSVDGSVSIGSGGTTREQIGSRDGDRVIQRRIGDLQLCMVGEGLGNGDRSIKPSQWLASAKRVLIETRRGERAQRLEVVRQAGGPQTVWQVGGVARPLDKAGEVWRDRVLAALDTTWELSSLRGQVSSLRGRISSVHGEESSLRGQISSLRGEISSLQGRISSVRGQESSLRGRISSIHGHVSSLRGRVSSERAAVASLYAVRSAEDRAALERISPEVARHNDEIARLDREIRDYGAEARVAAVEQEIKTLDTAGKVAAIEGQIRTFDLDGKVAAVERRIADLDVRGKVSAIEREIDALDADRRSRQLEDRRDAEMKQLERSIDELR